MAVLKNGPNGQLVGTLAKVVYYNLNGQVVSRSVGKTTKERTIPQLSVTTQTSISSKLLKQLQVFFNVGFSIEIKGTTNNAFNMAVSINRNKMMTGVYPDFGIDYSSIELSRGVLKPGENLQAVSTDKAILFSWDADPKMAWPESTDLVMLIAYFPEHDRSLVKIGGNARNTGADKLILPKSLKNSPAETYMAFVANDRKQVSDSTYLGLVNLKAQ